MTGSYRTDHLWNEMEKAQSVEFWHVYLFWWRMQRWADSGANMKGRGGLMVMLVQGEGWGCSITSALMTSPEFKVGRAIDGEVEERREEEGGGPSPSARPVRASVEIK